MAYDNVPLKTAPLLVVTATVTGGSIGAEFGDTGTKGTTAPPFAGVKLPVWVPLSKAKVPAASVIVKDSSIKKLN